MEAIQDSNHRKTVASWRKKFKQQWKKYSSLEINEENLQKYHTNAAMWTCGCESFLLSRFLLCKHIVHCYKDIEEPNDFFRTVNRQRSSPFWVQPQLILRPEFQPYSELSTNVDEESGEELNEEIISDSESDDESIEDDSLVQIDEEPAEICDVPGFVSKMNRLMNHLTEQYSIGNIKFAERLIKQNASNMTLLEEIEQRNRRHTRAPTWGNNRNSTTMYFQ